MVRHILNLPYTGEKQPQFLRCNKQTFLHFKQQLSLFARRFWLEKHTAKSGLRWLYPQFFLLQTQH